MNAKLIRVSVLLVALIWIPPSYAQKEEPIVDDGGPSCISTRRIRRIRIIDDKNILIYLSAQTIFHNVLRNACPGLERQGTFSYSSSDGLLCEGDGIAGLGGVVWATVPVPPTPNCWLGPHLKISKENADAMRDAKKNPPKIEPRPLPMPEPSEVSVEEEDPESLLRPIRLPNSE